MTEVGQLNIETPEQVPLQFNLAGVGSRFMAVAVDHALQTLVILIAALFLGIGLSLESIRGRVWELALFLLLVFVIDWGYFVIFETVWNGQTPGKRLVNIRVIQADGRPIALFNAMTRNLVRVIDILPGIYLTGVVCMTIDARSRRLGDLAAGTVVVHERAPEDQLPTYGIHGMRQVQSDTAYDVRALTTDDLILIEAFLARRSNLDYGARDKHARRIADEIRSKMGIPKALTLHDEKFLEAVAKTIRNSATFLKR